MIEAGTTRERKLGQGSTEKLAIFTAMLGMRFVTVDMDPVNSKNARQRLRYLNPRAEVINQKAEDFFAAFPDAIDFAYLDAFDIDHGMHSPERRDRYHANLGSEINDESCWQMHKACAESVAAKMPIDGIVVIDDTSITADGNYTGKGRLAVPYLLARGFELVKIDRPSAIALRRLKA